MGNIVGSQPVGYIETHTGDQPTAEANGVVKMVCHGTKGEKSEEITLDQWFRTEFKRGSVDKFDVYREQKGTLEPSSELSHITLWKDDVSSDWLLDLVKIESKTKKYVFPVFRWIKKDQVYNIVNYDTTLPMFEMFPDQREAELQDKRKRYEIFHHDGFIKVETLPVDENFSFNHRFNMLVDINTKTVVHKLSVTFSCWEKWNSFDEIVDLYGMVFEKPKCVDYWNEDSHFGMQRLNGLNYLLIKLVKEIPQNLPINDRMLQSLLEGMTISEAIANKKLFVVDLEILKDNTTKDDYELCAPIGLFYLNKDSQLLPVAIQLYQDPGENNPIYTPNDPTNLWTLVKMWFNNADSAFHEALVHLGMTHFLMEGVYLSTHRHLSVSHPIFKFLAPHFLYLLAINNLAVNKLLSPGGGIDLTTSYGGQGMLELVAKGLRDRGMARLYCLPEDIKTRDVGTDVLPLYPYRDDALLLYDALKTYAKEYVDLYYTSNDLLLGDQEVQHWVREMASSEGANFQDLPGNGKLTTNEQLVDILTRIIFTCSVSHAAANFNQYEECGFPPNYPMTLIGNPPKDKVERTERDILDALPSLDRTYNIMSLADTLSQKDTNSLGDFEVDYVFEPKAKPVKDNLIKNLKTISAEIKERNKNRKEPYTVLDPEEIPNSISI